MASSEELMMTYRKLVMPEDENPARRLFGGRLMQWADEAAALYAMCQMRTKSVVTLRISEILFKNPARTGDILEFWTRTKKVGRTSLTVECVAARKRIGPAIEAPVAPRLGEASSATAGNARDPGVEDRISPGSSKSVDDEDAIILSCEFVFVSIDANGKPAPHGASAPA